MKAMTEAELVAAAALAQAHVAGMDALNRARGDGTGYDENAFCNDPAVRALRLELARRGHYPATHLTDADREEVVAENKRIGEVFRR